MASRSRSERTPAPGDVPLPAGAPCWIDVAAPDPRAAARFYGQLFGWAIDEPAPPPETGWLVARLGGFAVAGIGALPRFVPPPTWNVYVRVADAGATGERVRQAGGQLLTRPFRVADAGRAAVCADPLGAAFRVWEPGTHAGTQLVDAPNAWLWSDLDTSDPSRARAFYADVFGWDAPPIECGRGASRLLRLPGLGASRGGVEDAIGWMTQIPATAARLQPHWSVTFAVADVHATVRACADLGGMVVAPPSGVDAIAQAALLADPFGAAFSVTSYEAG